MGDAPGSVGRRTSASSLEVLDADRSLPLPGSPSSGHVVDRMAGTAPHTGMHAQQPQSPGSAIRGAIPLPKPVTIAIPAVPQLPRAAGAAPQQSVLQTWRDPAVDLADARLLSAYIQAGATSESAGVFIAATRHQLAEIKLNDTIEEAFAERRTVDSANPIWSADTREALRNASEMIMMMPDEFFPRSKKRAHVTYAHETFVTAFQGPLPERAPPCTLREAMLQDMLRSIDGGEIVAHLQEHANDSCGQTANNVGIACLGAAHAEEFVAAHNAWERHATQGRANEMMLDQSALSFGTVTHGHGVESLQVWTASMAHAELARPIFVRIGFDSPSERGHGHQFALEIMPKTADEPLRSYIHMSWVGRFDEVMYARARGPNPDDLQTILGHLDAFCSQSTSNDANRARLQAEHALFRVAQPEFAFEAQQHGEHPPGLRHPEHAIRRQGIEAIPGLHCTWSACAFDRRPIEADEAVGHIAYQATL